MTVCDRRGRMEAVPQGHGCVRRELPGCHIELLDRSAIYWEFHSLLWGTQMMFSFLLLEEGIRHDKAR